jgi:hypothetical protein
MPMNYQALAAENLVKYGTDIARLGKTLLADRYSDRTHFVYELLQNAEDALSRRPKDSPLPKEVCFNLQPTFLEFSHFGLPFEEKDVRGICGPLFAVFFPFSSIANHLNMRAWIRMPLEIAGSIMICRQPHLDKQRGFNCSRIE